MTDQPTTGQIKRVTIDAPDGPTILAARHLDATEGRIQVGSIVDTAARAAITRVLDYVAKAHNSPAVTAGTPPVCSDERHAAKVADLEAELDELREEIATAGPRLSDMTRDRDRWKWYRDDAERRVRIQRERAEQAEAAERRMLAQRQEMAAERWIWQERGDRAEAFMNTVADIIADHEGDEWADHSATAAIRAAITRTVTPAEPAPEPAATQAAGSPRIPDHQVNEEQAADEPDTITDPEYLRQQYAVAIRAVWDGWIADWVNTDIPDPEGTLATAVLRVRDRHLDQLRQRLALADAELQQWAAAESADAAAGSYALRAEQAEQQRDQLSATLHQVLDAFEAYWARASYCGHSETAVQPERFQAWRAILNQPKEPTP